MSDTASNVDGQDERPIASIKRKAIDAGLPGAGVRPHKSVKRRASKACQCCRARKVRCNVVEQTPCTNCRLDEVECIVSESKRKKFVVKPFHLLYISLIVTESGRNPATRRATTHSLPLNAERVCMLNHRPT